MFYMKVTENSYSLFHGFNSCLASLCLSQVYSLLPEINRLKIQEHNGLTWWQLFLVLIFISFATALAFPFFCSWASVATPLAIFYLPISCPWWGPSFLRADSVSDLWTFVSVEAVLRSSWKSGNLSFLELCCDLSFGIFFIIWSAYWEVFRYFSFVQFFFSIHPSQCRAIVGESLLLNVHLISLDSAGFLSCFFITSG